jgi:hypothetical protein
MASLVGERGPELFVPKAAGTIIPNHQLGGKHEMHLHVDARGATDPAAVEAIVNRAFAKHGPKLVAASVHAQHEMRARRPAMRRG